ncbi:hypothetical protein [Bdellovibrio sp. GT3]|uniref:hypothetical protein n=1 Tax=Bdellovibrio sp. GT3 TaxID=3136282 RepID=UPI0030F05DB1
MEKIPFEVVQDSIDVICGMETEADLEKASEHLFDVQPDLGGFFMEFIEDMSEGAQDLGFMMALILNRAYEEKYGKMRAITEDEVVARFEKAEPEMESFLQMNDEMIVQIQERAKTEGQPELINYIIEELFMSPDLEPSLEADEQVHLFMVCKFFADCLNDVAKETAADIVRH